MNTYQKTKDAFATKLSPINTTIQTISNCSNDGLRNDPTVAATTATTEDDDDYTKSYSQTRTITAADIYR